MSPVQSTTPPEANNTTASPQARSIFNRLSRVEKLDLHSASQDRIHFLAHSKFRADMVLREVAEGDRESVLSEVRVLVDEEFVRLGETHFGV